MKIEVQLEGKIRSHEESSYYEQLTGLMNRLWMNRSFSLTEGGASLPLDLQRSKFLRLNIRYGSQMSMRLNVDPRGYEWLHTTEIKITSNRKLILYKHLSFLVQVQLPGI